MSAKRSSEAGPLDLVPIMNLVTILIPFLLMSAQFVSLAVVDSTLPAIADDSERDPDPEEQLGLSIEIREHAWTVSANQALGELETVRFACRPGACDPAELQDALATIKDRWPDEDAVVLVPEGSVAYERIIQTMDVARARDGQELFPNVIIAGGVGE